MQKISAGKFHFEPPFTSFDHLVGERDDPRRDFEAECFRGFQIEDELEFGRLLNWKVGGFGTLEDLVDVAGGTPKQVLEIGPVRHERAGCHIFAKPLKRRQSLRDGEIRNALSIAKGEWVLRPRSMHPGAALSPP